MSLKIPVRPKGLPGYSAWVGRNQVRAALSDISGRRHAILILDRNLPQRGLALKRARNSVRAEFEQVDEIQITGGEAAKSFSSIQRLSAKLTQLGARPDTILVAVGGGSIGDAVGFLASIYLRGIRWVCVPTTLLAQVDSALGGKTAINLPEGKNLVGTFHHPVAVICDLDFLGTLPSREVKSALGEVVKYGMAFDSKLLTWTIQNWSRISGKDIKRLLKVVEASLRWKSRIVSRDPFEKSGLRRQLNLGHTFGHAIEKAIKPRIPHGEAIFFGLRAALILSGLRGHLSRTTKVLQLIKFLESVPLPSSFQKVSPETILAYIQRDKKSKQGRTVFVLLKGIARLIEDSQVSEEEILRTWKIMIMPRRKRR